MWRLRTRIHKTVLPGLAAAVAGRAGPRTEPELEHAYRQTLMILFRTLYLGYAEARGLLPDSRNAEYWQEYSLTGLAHIMAGNPRLPLGEQYTLWARMTRLWALVGDGNPAWGVPAFRGGLFSGPAAGLAVEDLWLTDEQWGPALRDLLVDPDAEGRHAPVDFTAISIGMLGEIYEESLGKGLLIAPPAGNDTLGDDMPAGQVYLGASSGRRSSSSYYTPAAAVEYLLAGALDPAIDTHLKGVRTRLQAGHHDAAATELFDFKIADLAMGTGNFLIPAIDRVAGKYQEFLAQNPIRPSGELAWLAHAAQAPAGSPDAAQAAAMLRREIASRMIYGVDLDPLAVSLAQSVIQIHAFVPDLPVIDTGATLIQGNSLTGLANIEDPVTPAAQASSRDLPGWFGQQLAVLQARIDQARIDQAGHTRDAIREIVSQARPLFDAAVAVRRGLISASLSGQDAVREVQAPAVRERLYALQLTHLPAEFAEVFFGDSRDRRPGFDVLLGNPPWGRLHKTVPQEQEMVGIAKKMYRLQGAPDYAQWFTEQYLTALRDRGWMGVLLPGGSMTAGPWAPLRAALLRDADLHVTPTLNQAFWLFRGISHRTTAALVVRGPAGREPGVVLHSQVTSPTGLVEEQSQPGLRLPARLVREVSDSYVIPSLATAGDLDLFSRLATWPRLGSGQGWIKGRHAVVWNFKSDPQHAPLASPNGPDGAWKVLLAADLKAYGIKHVSDRARRYVNNPSALADLGDRNLGVEITSENRPRLKASHPTIVFRFATHRENFRTLIATALPDAEYLPSKDYVHGIETSPGAIDHQRPPGDETGDDDVIDQLALLGLLNSLVIDWWVRRLAERYITAPIIEGVPLVRLSPQKRREVAERVAELLMRGGVRFLPGGRPIDLLVLRDQPRPGGEPVSHARKTSEELLAEIEILIMGAFGLDAADLDTILRDFKTSPEAVSREYRQLLRDMVSNLAHQPSTTSE
jgi:hypothetical protein